MKLLIDECLSEELAKLARQRGHAEASHIVWIGKRGWKDWELKAVILDGIGRSSTRTASIFAAQTSRPVPVGYADVAVHAGLLCLSGPVGMDLDLQLELFEARPR